MTISPDWKFVFSHPARFIAFGFGSGLSPFAPGTAGTLVGFPLFLLIVQWGLALPAYAALIALLFIVGVWACEHVSRSLGVDDFGGIVWDEIVAFLAILYFTPATWLWWGVAFFVFRLFDVWKPFPIRHFDNTIKNGFGVMFDDALAAVYSIAVIQGLVWLANRG